MVLVFAIKHLYNAFKKNVSVHSFCVFFFNLALTNQMDWSTIPASPSLISLINIITRVILKEFFTKLCLCVLFYVCVGIGFAD